MYHLTAKVIWSWDLGLKSHMKYIVLEKPEIKPKTPDLRQTLKIPDLQTVRIAAFMD